MLQIINFGQVMDLEKGGRFTQQITVLLPNGRRVTIETDEATVQQLIQLAAPFVQGTEVKHFEPEEEQYRQEPQESSDDMDAIFGGEDEPTEPPMAKLAEKPTEPPEPAPSNGGGLGSGRAVPARRRRPLVDKDGFALPVPSRTVEKDEAGYPVVERSAAPPPGDDGADDGTQI